MQDLNKGLGCAGKLWADLAPGEQGSSFFWTLLGTGQLRLMQIWVPTEMWPLTSWS